MPNWWEQEPKDTTPQQAEWYRTVAKYRAQTGTGPGQPATWAQPAPAPAPQPAPLPTQPQVTAQAAPPSWFMQEWERRLKQPPPTAEPRAVKPAIPGLTQAQPQPARLLPPMPPGAPEYATEPEEFGKRGEELARQLFPQMFGAPAENLPKWMQRPEQFLRQATAEGLGRVIRAFERPEERALLGGRPGEELYKVPGEAPSAVSPEEYRVLMDPFARMRAVEAKKAEQPQWLQVVDDATGLGTALAELQVGVPAVLKMWERLTERSKAARVAEQIGAVGFQLLQEPAIGLEQATGATSIMLRPESRNLTVEQWFPLTTKTWSLAYDQARYRMGQTFLQTPDPNNADVLGTSLLDIANGRATAEEIALAREHLGAELVGQMAADPLQLFDWILAANKVARAKALSASQAKMLGLAGDSPQARRALTMLEKGLAEAGMMDAEAVRLAAEARGISLDPTTWDKIKEAATKPWEMTPESRVVADLEDMTVVLGPPIMMAESGDEAIQLLRAWADDPASLAPVFGRVPESLPGQKAGAVLRTIVDTLEDLPSVKAETFNPINLWVDIDELSHQVLRAAYGYTEPGKVGEFFLAYKRLMGEFYLNAATSPGYVIRNTLGDCAAMATDGLLTFESAEHIDEFMGMFGEIRTRRMMTEGAAGREALTGAGEIKSIFPGPLGEYSKAGQRFTRFAEPLGRLPLGEESRYKRAVYMALKRFWNENAPGLMPDLPDLARARFGDQAEHLRLKLAHEADLGKRRQALADFLEGNKGQQFEPTRYLDPEDLDAVSPVVMRNLRDELGKLTAENGTDDLRDVIQRVRDQVDEAEAARLAEMENLPPRIHVTTDVDEAEIADELIDTLEDIVARTGDEELARRVEDAKKAIPTVEEAIERARREVIDDLMTEPTPDGLEILLRANAEVEDLRNEWRKVANKLRRETKAAYDANPQLADEIWSDYFRQVDEGWADLANQRIERFLDARGQMQRLHRGEGLDDILGKGRQALAEERLLKASEVPDRPAGFLPGRVLRSDEDEKFERFLEWHRKSLDNVRANAWRAVYGAEPEDYGKVLDLLDSADRDIEQFGKATAGKVRQLYRQAEAEAQKAMRMHKSGRMRKLAVDAVWEKYYILRNDAWNRFWDAAAQRWKIAERDVLWGNWSRGPRMEPPTPTPTPRPPEAPPTPTPAQAALPAVQPGDEDLVKSAILKRDADWTDAEKEAIQRWTKSGQELPEIQPSIFPAYENVPTYTREQFITDLKAVSGITDDEAETLTLITDAAAKVWGKRTGRAPHEWYGQYLAGFGRGLPPSVPLYQGSEYAPRWWYKAEEVIGAKMPARADVEQIRNILTKGGIKKDELQWSGVLRWLDNQEGTLTKEDVLGYLQSNRVEVSDVVTPDPRVQGMRDEVMGLDKKLEGDGFKIEWEPESNMSDDYVPTAVLAPNGRYYWFSDARQMEQFAKEYPEHGPLVGRLTDLDAEIASSPDIRYQEYTTPGAEKGSYRELKLTLPTGMRHPEGLPDAEYQALIRELEDLNDRIGRGDYESLARAQAQRADLERRVWDQRAGTYEGPHWEEQNVLAHVRFTDRTGPNGERVLFLEEIQSDWHQAGREKGYRTKEVGQQINTLNARKAEIDAQIRSTLNKTPVTGAARQYAALGPEDKALIDALDKERQALAAQVLTLQQEKFKPPVAPFAKNWDELALKRMMRWAAENNYDAIGWTTGAQQAQRYNLAKQIDSLDWSTWKDGSYTVSVYRNDMNISQTAGLPTSMTPDELESYFGKDIARRIIEGGDRGTLEGMELSVGGEGMKGFYDRILPYSSDKLTKRWGVKAELGTIGEPQFKVIPTTQWDELMGTQTSRYVNKDRPFTAVDLRDPKRSTSFRTQTEAEDWILGRQEMARAGGQAFDAWTYTIPPGMKNDLMSEGLPLFQAELPGAKGATDFLEDGRAMFYFFQSADISTGLHEIGHVLRRTLPEMDLATVEKWAGLGMGDFERLHPVAVEHQWLSNLPRRSAQQEERMNKIATAAKRYEDAEEKWARAFERYLMEGEAPAPELRLVFEKFKEWLIEIYRKIVGSSLDVQMDDKIRGVMDRLLAESPVPRAGDPFGKEVLDLGRARQREEVARAISGYRHRAPLDIEDAQRLYQIDDPQNLARALEEMAQEHELLSTRESLRQTARKRSHAGGEERWQDLSWRAQKPRWMEELPVWEQGQYTTGVRTMSAKSEDELYWTLQGIDPKLSAAQKRKLTDAFLQEQKELADWYYTLAMQAQDLAAGKAPGALATAIPEAVARTSLEKMEAFDQLQELDDLDEILRELGYSRRDLGLPEVPAEVPAAPEGELARMARERDEARAAAMAGLQGRGGPIIPREEFEAGAKQATEKAKLIRPQLSGRQVRYLGPDTQIAATFTPLKSGEVYEVANVVDPGAGTIGLSVKLPNGEIAALNMTDLELVEAAPVPGGRLYQPEEGPPVFGQAPPKPGAAQMGMFEAGEELPLFTGTAPRAEGARFAPPEAAGAPMLPGMEPAMGDLQKYAARPAAGAIPGREAQPWQLEQGAFKKQSDIHGALRANYFEDERYVTSSRLTPAAPLDLDVGDWVLEDQYGGIYGHEIGQVRLLDPEDLTPVETDVLSNIQGRGTDARRYAQWIQEGKMPPPITVIEHESGALRITDGHRRYYAAKEAGVPVPAIVWPAGDTGKLASDGKMIKTGQTYEMALLDAYQAGEAVDPQKIRQIVDDVRAGKYGMELPGKYPDIFGAAQIQPRAPALRPPRVPKGQMTLWQQAQEHPLIEKLRQRIGPGTDEPSTGFLLTDGKFARTYGHNDIVYELTGDPSVVSFLNETGAIRVNAGTNMERQAVYSLTVPEGPLTPAQRTAIAKLLPKGEAEALHIFVQGRKRGPGQWYTINNSVDLNRFFKRSATLYQEGEQLGFWRMDPDQWRQYIEAIGQPGATAGPLPHEILQRSTDATRRSLDKIEQGMVNDWDQWQPMAADRQAQQQLTDWFDNEVTPSWYENRAVAYDYARSQADFTVLDYSKRRNFDTWMAYIFPYHYWFSRAGANWAKRLAKRPGMLANYIRARDAMKLANQQAGRRQRFEGMVGVPFPWLPDWMGDKVYIDPIGMIAPFSQIFGTDWDDSEDSKRGLQSIYSTAQQFGLRPYHIWDYMYQSGTFAKAGELAGMAPDAAQQMLGPEYTGNFPYVLPQTGVIRGITSLAREMGAGAMPPGGVNLEGALRRAIGLPAGEIWDPYRINRMLANLSAEKPQDMGLAQAALRAQELVERDVDQTGKMWDPSSELAQQTAAEMGWTEAQLAEAQRLLADAMQKATLERSIGTLGWALGPRMAVEPRGERAQLEMAEQARATTWTPTQPEGSREAYEQFKRTHPAMYPRSTQYNILPGEKEYEAMAPGARANWLILRNQRETLHKEYDQAVDDLLRAEPWNWTARNEIENQRRAALAGLEAKYPMPAMSGEIPAILYGMNPGEMWNSTVEKELYRLQATKPDPSAFETDEGIDWSAYYKAETKWRASLPRAFGFGSPQGGMYSRMDPKQAMEQFERRYDSPLEAAYRIYQKEVAAPAWDKYNQAKAQEDQLWPGMRSLQDQYWSLPQNQRGAFVREHPDLPNYWDWKDAQGSAYERTVGRVEATPAVALIDLILEQYQLRGWSKETLRAELAGVVFPSLSDQQALKKGQQPAAAATAAAGPTVYQRPQYTPAELQYLKNKILRQWNARQGKGGGWYGGYGGGGYGGGGRISTGRPGWGSSGSQYPRWRPPEQMWGGPFRR